MKESLFSKVIGEISIFYNSVQNSITCFCVPRRRSSRNFKKSTVCKATKSKTLSKFLKFILKFLENVQTELRNVVLF